MDIFNLTKPQKKVCRELIEMALQRECQQFVDSLPKAIAKAETEDKSAHETYLEIYKKVMNFDKKIARTYDNVTGAKYFMTVFTLYNRKVLKDKDLEIADDEMIAQIKGMQELFG